MRFDLLPRAALKKDRAGADGVHTDIGRCQRLRQVAGVVQEARFDRAIGAGTCEGFNGGGGGDDHDRAAARLAEVRGGELHATPCRQHVSLKVGAPTCFRTVRSAR